MKKTIQLSDFLAPLKKSRKEGAWYIIPRALYPNIDNMKGLHALFNKILEMQYLEKKELKHYQLALGEIYRPDQLILREWNTETWEKIYLWMIDKQIISPYGKKQNLSDKLANVRNYRNLITKLGFGYVNSERHFYISKVGAEFLSSGVEGWSKIIERQLCRLQFWNPSLDEKEWEKYQAFEIFPYLILLEIVLSLKDNHITNDEFILFVSTIKKQNDVKSIIDLIEVYRQLDDEEKSKIKKHAKFTFPEVANSKVHLDLFALTSTFVYEEHALVLKDRAHAVALLKHYKKKAIYVQYENFEDWYAFIGQPDIEFTSIDAARYYTKINKVEKAQKVLYESIDDLPAGLSLDEMIKTLFLEKHLEEAIIKNIKLLDPNLAIIKNGRQYPTEIGRIDILAKDIKNNEYVVIELKRDRAADKVIGQCLRYMGWVFLNLSKSKTVKGIIVGSKIEPELEYAKEGMQHPIKDIITFKSFKYDVHAEIK